ATILGFSKLAEYKDQETAGHLDRIQNYVRALTREIYRREIFIDYKTKKNYITEEYIEELSFSSLLHDIGKMGIPDNILQKPTRLTKEEFISMQSHTTIGGDTLKWLNDMVSEKTFLALAKEVAYFHHEKWNGKGYPFSLKEEEIPLSARIVGLCDVYDALTSKRSYKESYTHEKACEIIYNHASTQFDPAVISVFSSVEEEFRHIRKTYSE
ncbi:MAG TPA: HD domain-containing protein, partial [Spirochaetota bacterium]|nr:HD domain-containing protein [Spirochaetota bacterium]